MEMAAARRRNPRLVRVSLIALVAAVASLAFAPRAGAVTVGANLNQTPAFAAGCGALLIPPPSCAFFDAATAQTPPGNWRVTSARVRTGSTSGPMRITMIQALRSKSGAGGVICCTASAQGPVFTPPPNSTTRVNLNLPAVNTTEVVDNEQIEVIDYLGISLMNQAGSIAFAPAQFGSTFFDRAFSVGETRLGGGLPSLAPMIDAELQPCSALGSGASTTATACAPRRFAVSQRVRLSGNGTSARITVAVPGAGRVVVRGAGSAARLVRRSASNVREAGRSRVRAKLNARGRRTLNRRGRVKLKIRVSFKPNSGNGSSKNIRVRFRR